MFSLFTRRDNVITYDGDYKIENFKTDEGQTVCAWSINNVITRDAGPAITMEGGGIDAEMWVRDGLLHRADGPAIVFTIANQSTIEKWYIEGTAKNAAGGPNIRRDQHGTVTEEWLDENNLRHREGAPAVIVAAENSISHSWYIHGEAPAEGVVSETYENGALVSRQYAAPVDNFMYFEYYPDGAVKKKARGCTLNGYSFGTLDTPDTPDDPTAITQIEFYPDGAVKEQRSHTRTEKFTHAGILTHLSEINGDERHTIEWNSQGQMLEEKYYRKFNLHRDDGPAVTTYARSIRRIWYDHGALTRMETEDLPESQWRDGVLGDIADNFMTEEKSFMLLVDQAREETAAERKRANELARELAVMRGELEELRLRPGGLDYELAREHFHSLAADPTRH